MSLVLELPAELQSQLEAVARANGTDASAFVMEATRAAIEAATSEERETSVKRRARINAAIDRAQQEFAHLDNGTDAVSELLAGKRNDSARETER